MSERVQTTSVTELDPVCGMTVNPSSAKAHAEHAGKTYYFCSKHCVAKFRQDPAKYVNQPAASAGSSLVTIGTSKSAGAASAPATALAAKQKDPVCGRDVDPTTARHRFEHSGKTYYFCCGGCLEQFRADPGRFLNPKPSDNLLTLGTAPRRQGTDSSPAPLAQVVKSSPAD